MITYEELEKIAALAKLSLKDENKDALLKDISNILDFADAIAEVEIEEEGEDSSEIKQLRKDEVVSSLPPEKILSNAGEQRDGYFIARKRGGFGHE